MALNQDGSGQLSAIEEAKKNAAIACAKKHIPPSGCRLGVGSGSTVKHLVDYLAENYANGSINNLVCVATSYQTKRWLFEANLPMSDLDLTPELDVCIDGADEVDEEFNLIKGGGGCLAREKIVQTAARKFYVIADYTKQSTFLGEKYKYIPIEVLPFAAEPLLRWLPAREGGSAELRMATRKCGPVITDNNNYLIDWHFDKTTRHNWKETQMRLNNTPGVVDCGLFVGVTDGVFFAHPDGNVQELHAPTPPKKFLP